MHKRPYSPRKNETVSKMLLVSLIANLLWVIPASIIVLTPSIAQGAAPSSCQLTWQTVGAPPRISSDVAVVNENDVWVVGSSILHWDGTTWNLIQDLYLDNRELLDIAALSANDIWAAGWQDDNGSTQSLVMHWDGTNWSVVVTPDIGPLVGITVPSPSSVWVVGNTNASRSVPASIHWNGSVWQTVALPFSDPRAIYGYVQGISGVAENDLWAVGGFVGHTSGLSDATIWHWDGTTWNYLPMGFGSFAVLNAVSAVSSNDVWAVGNIQHIGALITHWDGNQWTSFASDHQGIFQDVTGRAADDAWAVGWYETTDSQQRLIEHWDGSNWNVVNLPQQGGYQNQLGGVAVVSQTEVWVVGNSVMHGIPPCLSTKPAKPDLVSPLNQSNVTSKEVKLRWKSVRDVSWYQVTIKKGDKVIERQFDVTEAHTRTKPLKRNNLYKWRVNACNSVGCRTSPWWQFTTSK